ncbi:piggyBac transposable element-derived protein 4-like [Patiria miniata]|uniref:PiggyBac transposable element-derived protein domain-containing protein n=1 Tax=Patiria miniata TaxID=46514 RepID=A0A914A9B6_PATMI|nr:piggyBac transposable element-derived protein 4-like [Patiria miniata]
MGLVRIPYYQDYWSSEPGYYNRLISTTMTRSRFDFLTQHFACSDPATNPERYPHEDPTMFTDKAHKYNFMAKHPLYPLQPVWDTVLSKCRANFNLGRNLAIDEAMVKYSGFKAHVRKFFMPLKPIRTGFKLYALADSATGYLANFIVQPFKSGAPAKMTDIAMAVASPVFGVYHHIFGDKLYSSVELCQRLLADRTYYTGAVKSTSKNLPRDFRTNPDKNPQQHQKIKNLNKMP